MPIDSFAKAIAARARYAANAFFTGDLALALNVMSTIENALGDGVKKPSSSEMKNKSVVRKSIVAARNIQKGETFTEEHLAIKRPGTGISPMKWNEVIGSVAQKDYKTDEMIRLR